MSNCFWYTVIFVLLGIAVIVMLPFALITVAIAAMVMMAALFL